MKILLKKQEIKVVGILEFLVKNLSNLEFLARNSRLGILDFKSIIYFLLCNL